MTPRVKSSRRAWWLGGLAALAAMLVLWLWLSGPRIVSPQINEASGMGLIGDGSAGFWIINDSGEGPILHAITKQGRQLGRTTIHGAINRDWEAIADGPCGPWLPIAPPAPQQCFFIGDTGTNGDFHSPVRIFIFAVPATAPATGNHTVATLRELTVVYPSSDRNDVAPDVEAMVVDRINQRILLFQKWRNGADALVFSITSPDINPINNRAIAKPIAILAKQDSLRQATGPFTDASITSDAQTLIIRDYRRIYRVQQTLATGADFPIWQLIPLKSRPVALGEALALSFDGKSITYTSEGYLAPLITVPLIQQ